MSKRREAIRITTFSVGALYQLQKAGARPGNVYGLSVEATTRYRKQKKRKMTTSYCGVELYYLRKPGGDIIIMAPEEYEELERIRLEKKRKKRYEQLQREIRDEIQRAIRESDALPEGKEMI